MSHNHICRDCGAVLYSCSGCDEEAEDVIDGRCPDCQRKMGEFWTVEWAFSYGITISRARYHVEAADRYSPDYKPYMMIGIGDPVTLNHIDYPDLPDRESDGCFNGCTNKAWIISDAEREQLLALEAARQAEVDAKLEQKNREDEERWQAEKARRETIRSGIKSAEVKAVRISDEGGKTTMYQHTITCLDGEVLKFAERNIYDFGIVANPDYDIAPGIKGGLPVTRNGITSWEASTPGSGFGPVRPITANEQAALAYIGAFGGFAGRKVRM